MAEIIERQAAIKAAEHAYNEWNLAMAAADGQRQINRVFKMQELCKAVISVFENVPATDLDCTGCMKSVSFGTSTAAAARCPNAFLI